MAQSAKVLVVEAENSGDAALSEGLRACGLEPQTLTPAQCGGSFPENAAAPDILLLNLASRAARADAPAWLEAAALLHEHSAARRLPALMVGEPADLIGEPVAGSWDDTLPAPASAAFVASRINTLLRLHTMRQELNRRMSTCARYGMDAPQTLTGPCAVDDAAILVLSSGAAFGAIESALSRSAELVGAFTPASAEDYLQARSFDAVVMDANVGADAIFDFVSGLRLNPKNFDLPLLLADVPADADWVSEAFNAGVTEILSAPLDGDLLRQRALTLAGESRFRETLKSTYRQARHMATSDALTGLYSRGFLMEHLKGLTDARAGQAFSLAALQIRNLPGLNQEYGYITGDRIIRQVGDVIAHLTRGEDLVARFDGSSFAVLLPGTRQEAASAAVKRIEAVVSFTEFSVEDVDGPIKAGLRFNVIEADPGESPEALAARAFSFDLEQDL